MGYVSINKNLKNSIMAEQESACIIAWTKEGVKGVLLKKGQYCPVISPNGLFQYEVCIGFENEVKRARINPMMSLMEVDSYLNKQGYVKIAPIDCGLVHY